MATEKRARIYIHMSATDQHFQNVEVIVIENFPQYMCIANDCAPWTNCDTDKIQKIPIHFGQKYQIPSWHRLVFVYQICV